MSLSSSSKILLSFSKKEQKDLNQKISHKFITKCFETANSYLIRIIRERFRQFHPKKFNEFDAIFSCFTAKNTIDFVRNGKILVKNHKKESLVQS
jgi:hypothetical protein